MIERIGTTFRASLYLLLTLSSIAIGFSEGNFFPHFFTLPLIMLAYAYLDDHPLLRLEDLSTSILGILALVVAIIEFQQGRVNVEMRILSASHLLAYFTWIVLLIEKQNQQYWWLLALSVLNMAVAASLTSSGSLGLAVVAYLFLAVWTLALFTAFRGTASLRGTETGNSPAPPDLTQPVAAGNSRGHSTVGSTSTIPVMAASRVRGGFHFDPAENWLGARLVGNVLFLSLASMLVGMALFTVTPRIWIGNWQLPSSPDDLLAPFSLGNKMSGFTSEVRLGDMGEILENTTPVIHVQFMDATTNSLLNYEEVLSRYGRDEILFRGTALSRYKRGHWAEEGSSLLEEVPSHNAPRDRNAIRINHNLEPVGRSTLFTIYPVDYGILLNEEDIFQRLQQNVISQEISMVPNNMREGFSTIRYETISVPDRNTSGKPYTEIRLTRDQTWQKLLETISKAIEAEYQAGDLDFNRKTTDISDFDFDSVKGQTKAKGYDQHARTLLKYDRSSLERLTELAQQLCETGFAITPLTPEERCLKIFDYLKNSGEFSYTLNMAIMDPNIDPVEDFVFLRKSGHCEYFASAMVLMLRAVGVPARMASGFKGGRWDERRSQLVVEQRHAHVWVEAFVDGRWLVIDPTTASDYDLNFHFMASNFSWSSIVGYLNNFWQVNVIGISLARQQNDIYEPIQRKFQEAREWTSELAQSFRGQNNARKKSRLTVYDLIFYLSIFFSLLVIIGGVLLYLYSRNMLFGLRWNLFSRHGSASQQQMVLFFRQFLEISSRNGLKKKPHQTAREFARQFEERFRQQLSRLSLEALPLALTNAYYQARFRGDDLTAADLDHWKVQIQALGQALEREPGKLHARR